RWRAREGAAALLGARVSGCRRSPRLPAITIPSTRGIAAINGRLRASVKACARQAVRTTTVSEANEPGEVRSRVNVIVRGSHAKAKSEERAAQQSRWATTS